MFLKEIFDLQEECESGEVALIMFRQIKTLLWINKNKLSNSLHCKAASRSIWDLKLKPVALFRQLVPFTSASRRMSLIEQLSIPWQTKSGITLVVLRCVL